MSRQVSIREASEALGVTRKTIERYIHDGKLSATKKGNRYILTLPDDLSSLSKRLVKVATEVQLAAALAELEAVKAERDRLIEEGQEKSRQINQLTMTLFQFSQQRVLPAPRHRPWWRFWERDEVAEDVDK